MTSTRSPGRPALRWSEVDLDHGVLFIVRSRTTAGYQVVEGEPKTLAGPRAVALDRHTVKILLEHRRRQLWQRAERLATGAAWRDSGYVFNRPDGAPIHPGYATTRFRLLVQRTHLPPVRLHDLRHGAASLATKPVQTSRPCRTCSATPASWSPPTPTPASSPSPNAAAPRTPPGSSSPPPAAPARRSRTRGDGPSRNRRSGHG
ncbi:MAG: hypothetical protein ACRDT4_14365 [Micromonosporaceae bacterium]